MPPAVITRPQLLTLLEAALRLPETLPAAQDLALAWLKAYPGDLAARAAYARILLARGQSAPARHIAARLCRLDPADGRAQSLLVQAARREQPETAARANACLLALGEQPWPNVPLPPWGAALARARRALETGDLPAAERNFHAALSAAPETPLLACTHLRLLAAQAPPGDEETHCTLPPVPAVRSLLAHYRARWPECLPLALWHAEHLLASGQEARAVAILHRCATQDLGGQTPIRLWGAAHPYRALWPEELRLPLEQALPAPLSALLGWNQLPGAPAGGAPPPQTEAAPKRAGAPGTSRRRRLFGERAAYVILTTLEGLRAQYGEAQSKRVWAALRRLQQALEARFRGGALLVAADSARGMAQYGLPPAAADDPWGIKLTLHDVQDYLHARGRRIGALLIVGGGEVVPFHRLPNPVADDDPDVPSDAPYGSADEDYFLGQWPVGRLPGDASGRAGVLIAQIEALYRRYRPSGGGMRRWQAAARWLRTLLIPAEEPPQALGYTAAVWWRAAVEVMRPIGSPADLRASPPTLADEFIRGSLRPARMGYFNLHGRVDAAEWFGQCDPRAPCEEDYPVALRPQDVARAASVPRVIFSEACYGAHLEGRRLEDSLALQFLAHGAQAVAGSTVLAYGAPGGARLIAADLLGQRFWRALRRGLTAGEALRQARLEMAAELQRRQGLLDAEDQKTLISFVLYGDPLARVQYPGPLHRPKSARAPLWVTGLSDGEAMPDALAPEVAAQVKQMVQEYLPGMRGAAWSLHAGHAAHPKGGGRRIPRRQVVILHKAMPGGRQHQYARVTLDERGRVARLAVSR